MIVRPLLALLLLASPAVASPAERRLSIGSFDRIRVEGPVAVSVATGRSPGGTVSGDARSIETVEVRVDGTTLVVRTGRGTWGERPDDRSATPLAITLATPSLVTASVVGGGRLSVDRMRGTRVEASVTGAGGLSIGQIVATDRVNATVIGTGEMALAGTTPRARLITNGSGRMDAAGLRTDELVVRLEGLGVTRAQARYTAQVTSTGLGSVTIAGTAKCDVRAASGAPVRCGAFDETGATLSVPPAAPAR